MLYVDQMKGLCRNGCSRYGGGATKSEGKMGVGLSPKPTWIPHFRASKKTLRSLREVHHLLPNPHAGSLPVSLTHPPRGSEDTGTF